MRPADRWEDAGLDFQDDTWLFDAGADGKYDLAITFAQEEGKDVAYLYDDQNGDGQVGVRRRSGGSSSTSRRTGRRASSPARPGCCRTARQSERPRPRRRPPRAEFGFPEAYLRQLRTRTAPSGRRPSSTPTPTASRSTPTAGSSPRRRRPRSYPGQASTSTPAATGPSRPTGTSSGPSSRRRVVRRRQLLRFALPHHLRLEAPEADRRQPLRLPHRGGLPHQHAAVRRPRAGRTSPTSRIRWPTTTSPATATACRSCSSAGLRRPGDALRGSDLQLESSTTPPTSAGTSSSAWREVRTGVAGPDRRLRPAERPPRRAPPVGRRPSLGPHHGRRRRTPAPTPARRESTSGRP